VAGLALALVVFSFVGWRWNTRRVLLNERAVLEEEMATAPLLSADLVEKYQVSTRTLLEQARLFGQVRIPGRRAPSGRSNIDSSDDKKKPSLAKLEEQAIKIERAVTAIEWWDADNIDWLKELRIISITLAEDADLGSQEILISKLNARRVQKTGRGEITLKGRARNSDAIENMERALRDVSYRVEAGDKSVDSSHDKYPQLFGHTLSTTGGDHDNE
jgi:hypothetical protein